MPRPLLAALVSPLFVLIWSTGFVVARYGLPYGEPGTLLLLRFAGTLAVMLPLALYARVQWPSPRLAAHMAVAGVFLQAGYLGGVWVAIKLGMGAGMAALIVGMQPVLTAIAGQWLGDRPNARQWAGLALGFAGVALVVWKGVDAHGLDGYGIAWAVFGLLSITGGTLYQRRFCPALDLRTGSVLQFGAALAVTLPFVLFFETGQVQWSWTLIGALLWAVLALSVGAISLLFLLIRHGAATKVASLMYLTPSVTALMAWLLFGEVLTPLMIAGMAVTAVGVAWAQGR